MIGTNIRRLMKEQGITQAELAKLAHISQSYLSDIINGVSKPKSETLEVVAESLNTSVTFLVEGNNGLERCPRCGSTMLLWWTVASEHKFRCHCGFCELDSGEQKTQEKAVAVMQSFEKKSRNNYTVKTRVLTLSEVLDDSSADTENVKPIWFENRGLFVAPSLLLCGVAEREQKLVRVLWWGETSPRSFLFSKYGSWWRVWNEKPTQGMLDETPWSE